MLHDIGSLSLMLCKNGYWAAYYPRHPMAWKGSGLVYAHRLVMENRIGRYLRPSEHIHHIDKDRGNNDFANLEITTPSEHKHLDHPGGRVVKRCLSCGLEFSCTASKERGYCSIPCGSVGRCKIEWPSNSELRRLVWLMPITKLSAMLGVSDVAIKKRCKKSGIETPTYGYWIRVENRLGVV